MAHETKKGGGVPDGSYSKKAAGMRGKSYEASTNVSPHKSNPTAEAEEKGGSKQK